MKRPNKKLNMDSLFAGSVIKRRDGGLWKITEISKSGLVYTLVPYGGGTKGVIVEPRGKIVMNYERV